ncbi:hypothetical protein M2171_005393 [Bradyrhizobium japonicum USDA 38]|uniref:hypothetical protein n=1 Tax=Bradyrhizobium japonicum TaxID=375 RepID=UPI0012BD3F30|nr:hypothetical protein [Bradyrhizobium japonicum]MCS3896260.1 hypothetical protein [Bradyrhizobium japonicum USDA 38]MCS3948774.1 hypothetical protein [Bradyrhizobium japonicum]
MNEPVRTQIAPVPDLPARRTRVKLRRVSADLSKPYPPEGDQQRWWGRLKAALGTTSSDFVNATLVQIQSASRLPTGGISEVSVNAALAFIESTKPKNELEAALAIQMACTHAVAMAVLSRVGGGHGGDRHVTLMAAAGARLLRAFATQVEAMRRLRNGGSQYMRIEHVHLEPGAQAVIGNMAKGHGS